MAVDRLQRQRFELKFVIEESTALRLRDFVSEYLDLDEFGVGRPSYAYPVHSIYLDSPQLTTFWHWVNADRNRFKLRIRFYDDKPESPVFCEIKRRVSNCILKQRCGVHKQAVRTIMEGQFPPLDQLRNPDAKNIAALERFIEITQLLQARPRALVSYLREAYQSEDCNAVRVTMDRQVRIAPRDEPDFRVHMDYYVQPFGNRVILELKFTNRFPKWMTEMVQNFQLTRGAAAKYCEGVAALWHPEYGNLSSQVYHTDAFVPEG